MFGSTAGTDRYERQSRSPRDRRQPKIVIRRWPVAQRSAQCAQRPTSSRFAPDVTGAFTGLGFIDLFSIPDRLTHLRRWAFQDVLLVAAHRVAEAPATSVSFARVLDQIDEIVTRCEELQPGCANGPRQMPWNSVEVTVVTLENARIVMTAAGPIDPDRAEVEYLRAGGIEVPGVRSGGPLPASA